MLSDFSRLALAHVPSLKAYAPGMQPGEEGWVKLNTNECPYPPSPKVAEALHREIGEDGRSLRLYPSPTSGALRAAVAALHGLAPENVCIGNGSDDLLNLLARCCCDELAPAGFTMPSYSLYPVLVSIQDGEPIEIEFDRDMRLPVETIAHSQARVFFLTSPNAPTGVGFRRSEIEAVLKAYRGLFVVDEAYAPFADEDAIPLLRRFPHLVILRTLSKAYALAGIRVGYALAAPEVIGWLDRVRDSYNVSRLSQTAALAALSDPAYYAEVVRKVKATRDGCYEDWSKKRGWFTYRSQSNFLSVEPKNAKGEAGPAVARSAYEFLISRKILVRLFPSHALTASFLRVSIGTDDEMRVLNQSLDEWLKMGS